MAKPPSVKNADVHPVEIAMRELSRAGSTGGASGEAARQSLKAEKELNSSLPLSLDVPAEKIIPKPKTGE